MFKQLLSAVVLSLALLVSTANATDATGSVSLTNNYVDRGLLLSNQPSVGLDLTLHDVLLKNVFLTGNFNTINRFGGSDSLRLRSDVGVGYGRTFGQWDFAGSLHYLGNTAFERNTFSELRAEAGFKPVENVRLYAHGARALTSGNSDTYLGVGGTWSPVAVPKLTLGLESNAYWYDTSAFRFNNVVGSASYNFYKNFDLFGSYSSGGRSLIKDSIGDQYQFGVRMTF
jgi:hypothetical protein